MANRPPEVIVAEYMRSVKKITRRIEIYEQDGKTPWVTGKDAAPSLPSYGDLIPASYASLPYADLVDGSISVDYDRSERRSLDLTLDNRDGKYSPDQGGFWYDKVIKVFRGISVPKSVEPPSIIIIEDQGGVNFGNLRTILKAAGFYDVRYKVTNPTFADVQDSDIVIAASNTGSPSCDLVIDMAVAAGKSVLTIGQNATNADYPRIISTTIAVVSGATRTITPVAAGQAELVHGWNEWSSPGASYAGTLVSAGAAGTKTLATDGAGQNSRISALSLSLPNGGKWVHLHASTLPTSGGSITSDVLRFFRNTLTWLDPKLTEYSWECQVGEFMIDSIDEPRSPRQITLRGRDYTKKLLNAKFITTTSFQKTEFAETTIRTLAINGGISPTKIVFPTTRTALGTVNTFERGTDRWTAMKQIGDAFNLELFFDNVGNLVIRPFLDPSTSAASFYFTSGPDTSSSLTDFTRSTSSASIYNQVVVAGESSDQTKPPVYAVANNTNPNSPSNQSELGVITYYYSSAAITTTAQAQALANKFLSVNSLEEFTMSWGSFVFDWLEVGEIVDIQPSANDYTAPSPDIPTRYLLTSLTIPLSLGPMSANGKRVVIV